MEKLNMQTQDMAEANIEKIGQLFPNCLTERLNENGKPITIPTEKLPNPEIWHNEKHTDVMMALTHLCTKRSLMRSHTAKTTATISTPQKTIVPTANSVINIKQTIVFQRVPVAHRRRENSSKMGWNRHKSSSEPIGLFKNIDLASSIKFSCPA